MKKNTLFPLFLLVLFLSTSLLYGQNDKVSIVENAVNEIQQYINKNVESSIVELRTQISNDYNKLKITFTKSEYIELISKKPQLKLFLENVGVTKVKYQFIPNSVVKYMAFEEIAKKQPDMLLSNSSLVAYKKIDLNFYNENLKKYPNLLSSTKIDAFGNAALSTAAYSAIAGNLFVMVPLFVQSVILGGEVSHSSIVMGAIIAFVGTPLVFNKKIRNMYKRYVKEGFSSQILNRYWFHDQANVPWFTGATDILSDNGFVIRDRWREKEYILSLKNKEIFMEISFVEDLFKVRLNVYDDSASFKQVRKTSHKLAGAISQALNYRCDQQYL